ncbi:MAG: Chk1 protein kinase [Watsoniomyces obsoletus]|nr:MAG: Chk1 protein kinase [Watsoniomyces obsoletus]
MATEDLPPSQTDPLPGKLPFRLISNTIARGAYASIRKAVLHQDPSFVIAVKFINKQWAIREGRLSAKQIEHEVALHSHVNGHNNIIQFYHSDQDHLWRWIALEYADGGDLFDKIEADVGVPEDVAHCYFLQLVSAVSFMHSKGVAHRDIKPENILLSGTGQLKVADFGLAALFAYNGEDRLCNTVCGSPPYVAPEVVTCVNNPPQRSTTRTTTTTTGVSYRADRVDVWSCAVVLFVLLVGNTPWDEPTSQSWEFLEYVRGKGRSEDELWQRIPSNTISLLRGMMKVDPSERWTFEEVRRHPWFTRTNPYVTSDGKMKSPVTLATTMLENLRIDFAQDPISTKSSVPSSQEMMTDDDGTSSNQSSGMVSISTSSSSWLPQQQQQQFAATQPDTPSNDTPFDWELPASKGILEPISSSQPLTHHHPAIPTATTTTHHGHLTRIHTTINLTTTPVSTSFASRHQQQLDTTLSEDPSMSQFSTHPGVPMSLTQRARQFQDIVPSQSLTRFLSHQSYNQLLPLLSQSLHRLGVPIAPFPPGALQGRESNVVIKFQTVDQRKCQLKGYIVVERTNYYLSVPEDDDGDDMDIDGDGNGNGEGRLLEVRFDKIKGDPLEWRRFFKKVVVLCKEGVYIPR